MDVSRVRVCSHARASSQTAHSQASFGNKDGDWRNGISPCGSHVTGTTPYCLEPCHFPIFLLPLLQETPAISQVTCDPSRSSYFMCYQYRRRCRLEVFIPFDWRAGEVGQRQDGLTWRLRESIWFHIFRLVMVVDENPNNAKMEAIGWYWWWRRNPLTSLPCPRSPLASLLPLPSFPPFPLSLRPPCL